MSEQIENKERGVLVVLSAPSGAGKTTIVDRLLKKHSDWVRSISVTTRKPRDGEVDGKDYFFASEQNFLEMEKNCELLESAKVIDNFYGTPREFVEEQLEEGRCVLLAIDVQGADSVRRILKGKTSYLTIFVLPPSLKVLKERLEGRKTETPEQVERRLEVAKIEIKEAGAYDHTVVNQNIDETVAEIEGFIKKYREQSKLKVKSEK